MTYFSLNITNRCNKACSYCINKDYVNNQEYPDLISLEDLKKWLEFELKENDIVEIAGTGEPTLCEWLPDLLNYLEGKMAWVILRTNGFELGGWRLSLTRLLVILAKHDNDEDYVRIKCKFLLPSDLIITEIKINQKQGENKGRQPDALGYESHPMQKSFFVTPDGKVRPMSCTVSDRGTILDYKPAGWTCTSFSTCSFIVGAYNFIEYLKERKYPPESANHTYMQAKTFMEK